MFLVNIRRRFWLLGKKDVAGFVRDFVPIGLSCLMIEPPETLIMKLFLLKTLFLVGLGRWRVSWRSIYIISLISFLLCTWLNRNLLLESKFSHLYNIRHTLVTYFSITIWSMEQLRNCSQPIYRQDCLKFFLNLIFGMDSDFEKDGETKETYWL